MINSANAMATFGAKVNRIEGNYEDSLAACKTDAEANNWHIVSDTSWTGYREIPCDIMAGYSVMGREVVDQLGSARPTHCHSTHNVPSNQHKKLENNPT